jgi:uncharacterized protein YqhQ
MAHPSASRGTLARALALFLNQGSALVGGQAVLEGVLMRIPTAYAVAVRTPKGEIRVKKELLPETAKGRFGNLPIIRGSVILFKALMLGISALNFSAEVAMEEEETPSEGGGKTPQKKDAKTTFALAMTVVFSLAMGVVLFFYVPLLLTQFAGKFWAPARGTFGFNLVDGAIRLVIFLAYILLISLLKDIRRVFAYHGSEHKVVHTWEAQKDLTVENTRGFSVLHPRCGTSFLLFVMAVSILVFSVVPHDAPFWMKAASRLVFLPLIAGLSYEMIRLTARFPCSWWSKPLLLPGLALQRLTTREPDDSMLEVALHALREALELDRIKKEAA